MSKIPVKDTKITLRPRQFNQNVRSMNKVGFAINRFTFDKEYAIYAFDLAPCYYGGDYINLRLEVAYTELSALLKVNCKSDVKFTRI